ncbi:MAG: PDZ domain-containing protein [Candidatus Velthaea sp.]|jgi:PDZ domain-containing protein
MPARRRWFVAALIGAAILVALAAVPLPAYLIAPGSAIDLTRAVLVARARPPTDRLYMTDVSVIRASPLRLLLALAPGVVIEPAAKVVPRGISAHAYDDAMHEAMDASQAAAAVVAERAAGYAVPIPPARLRVQEIGTASAARGTLEPGDWIRRIDDRPVSGADDVRRALDAVRPGATVRVDFQRGGRERSALIRTTSIEGHVRLGILLVNRYERPSLPRAVHYTVGDVGGSSGGLMMALRIYDALHGIGGRAGRTIAGTGTLSYDGAVGPIEGTIQKLIGAQRAGASVFLVPRANYASVANQRGLRVIPVASFTDALRALDS